MSNSTAGHYKHLPRCWHLLDVLQVLIPIAVLARRLLMLFLIYDCGWASRRRMLSLFWLLKAPHQAQRLLRCAELFSRGSLIYTIHSALISIGGGRLCLISLTPPFSQSSLCLLSSSAHRPGLRLAHCWLHGLKTLPPLWAAWSRISCLPMCIIS